MSTEFRAVHVFALCLTLLFAHSVAYAQGVAWTATTPGGIGDVDAYMGGRSAMALDNAGNVFVTGSALNGNDADFLTTKFAPGGAVVWSVRFNSAPGSSDAASAVAVDSQGNVFVVGGSTTIKYQGSDGALLWRVTDAPAAGSYPFKIVIDAAGDAIVGGGATGAPTSPVFRIIKYRGSDGAVLWTSVDNVGKDLFALAVDAIGNVVIAGTASNPGAAGNLIVGKYAAATGVSQWHAYYSGYLNLIDDFATSGIAIDASGDVVVIGDSVPAFNNNDFLVVKLRASDGTRVWTAGYDGAAHGVDLPHAVAVDSNGDVLVSGASQSATLGLDYVTVKYSGADGLRQWATQYDGTGHADDQPSAITVDAAGNVVVTGSSDGFGTGRDFATLKYNGSTGAQLWLQRYSYPGLTGSDDGLALAIRANGDVVVAGKSLGATQDVRVVEYASGNGTQQWAAKESDGGLSERLACNAALPGKDAAAVDSQGNTFVVGCSFNGNNDDYVTAKFSPTGALLWVARYNGPANLIDYAVAVAVDAQGDVLVAGSSLAAGGDVDALTIKYRGTDGAPLWSSRYARGSVQALTLDAAGNAYITGSSIAAVATDYVTIKYRNSDGALLWESHYNGPGNGLDSAQALTVTADGQVVVTGGAQVNGGNYDYATVSYRAVDGVQNWVRLYSRSALSPDRACCIASDANGDLFVSGKSLFSAATVKYRGSDGQELWSSFESEDTDVFDLAVDGVGDVLVVGYSVADGFLTSKHLGGSGALSWSRTYGTFDASRAYAATVDAFGNAIVTGIDYLDGGYEYVAASYNGVSGADNWVFRPIIGADSTQSAASIKTAPDGSLRMIVSASTSQGPRISISKIAAAGVMFASGFE